MGNGNSNSNSADTGTEADKHAGREAEARGHRNASS
jgi:hypothetical protein